MKKPFDKRIIIIFVGLVILLAISVSWTGELSYVQERLLSGANVERGAQIRSAINNRYAIWFIMIIFITSALTYIVGRKS